MVGLVEDYSTNISKNFCQNICNEIAINANFHFPHYKSMETETLDATAAKVHMQQQ